MQGLKFRAWDKLNKKYVEPVAIYFVNGKVSWVDYVENGQRKILNQSEFVLEQCTGLKDKNGVEICEGNIIQFVIGNKAYVREVIKEPTLACFMLIKKGSNTGYSFLEMYQMNVDEFEVIGNIHENAELLEEQ